jgi:hypothetical protein
MKNRLLYLLFAFLPLLSWSQHEQTFTINWMADGTETISGKHLITYPVFEGSVNHRNTATLPCFLLNLERTDSKQIETEIVALQTDTLYFNTLDYYSDADLLTNNWQVNIDYTGETTKIYLLPMKKQGNKIVRLTKFKITINNTDADIDSRSAAFIPQYTDESVLNTGTWYKIGITKSGIYKLSYTDLTEAGIDPSGINPKLIRLYGQYSGMLPEANDKPRPDDLTENAIEIIGEEDGTFNEEDYILFAAQGPVIWRYNMFTGIYEQTNNLYSDTVYYFLTVSDSTGKRVKTIAPPAGPPDQTLTTFNDHAVVDHDLENVTLSGKLWLGERFEGDVNSHQFAFDFPNRIKSKPVLMKMNVVARGVENSYFTVTVNNNTIIDSARVSYVGPNSGHFARERTSTKYFNDEQNLLKVKIVMETGDISATGWLNYLLLNAECELKWRNSSQMIFGNHLSMNENIISKFVLSEVPDNIQIWDITEVTNPQKQLIEKEGTTAGFTVQGKTNQHFIAFDGSSYLKPATINKIANQNLHGTGTLNMVIVTPPIFLPQANELAELHRVQDNFTTKVVTTEQIYNEFSSGMQDISAIRDYLRMLYLRNAFKGKPGYLLLFGDASFDYKDRLPDNNNMVPTFESLESLKFTTSYATDDFFGLLDDNEGFNAVGDLDIGIGRLPVSTIEQANTAVNKIKIYTSRSADVMRDWRNDICFIADDQDMNLHLNQAKSLVSIVDTSSPELNINKIYSDAYYREKISGGYRYPDVHQAIIDQVNKGALIINYTGHGGLTGWAEELILDMPAIRSFSNLNQMPLFITATCEFSRFDDPLFQSAGELVFLNETGGGIALMTTTRLAYAHANIAINSRLYLNLKNSEGNELPRLGDLMRMAKTPSSTNYLNFVLLGDPAMRLAFPEYEIITTSVKNTTGKTNDTIKAMGTVTITGEIQNNGNIVNDFNGYLYPKVYDKKVVYTTRANDPRSYKEDFTLFDKLIYTGKITVSEGRFEFTFVVPDGISYHFGNGRVSYYALDTVNFVDATGYYQNLVVGGIDPDAEPDYNGPEIVMYMNHPEFNNNDVIDKNSTLYATISDPNGISYTGLNIGRDMLLIFDNDYSNTKVVNNLFKPDVDSYTGGTLTIPFENLSGGHHSLTLRAWDLQGNSNEQTIGFTINPDTEKGISNVTVYPNPFNNNAVFRFNNKNGESGLSVSIKVFAIDGKLVGEMNTEISNTGNVIEIPFNWQNVVDGDNNPQAGIFIYEMTISGKNGFKQVVHQKMIKLTE